MRRRASRIQRPRRAAPPRPAPPRPAPCGASGTGVRRLRLRRCFSPVLRPNRRQHRVPRGLRPDAARAVRRSRRQWRGSCHAGAARRAAPPLPTLPWPRSAQKSADCSQCGLTQCDLILLPAAAAVSRSPAAVPSLTALWRQPRVCAQFASLAFNPYAPSLNTPNGSANALAEAAASGHGLAFDPASPILGLKFSAAARNASGQRQALTVAGLAEPIKFQLPINLVGP